MRLLKNHIALVHPTAHFLCSICNEDQTDGDISAMGERLAEEVRNFISDLINDGSTTLSRLSFVGHSLGGLIARAALHLLSEFRGNFHSFLCLSTPHLGCRVSANRLVDAGIWVLKQWKKYVFSKKFKNIQIRVKFVLFFRSATLFDANFKFKGDRTVSNFQMC